MPTPRARRTQEIGALPGVRLSPNAPAGAFGGNTLPDLSPATREIAGILSFERQKADQIAFTDADTKLAETQTQLQIQTQQKRGKDSFTAPEEVMAQWDKTTSEIEQGLASERVKFAFRRAAMARRTSLDAAVQRHVAGERTAYDNQVTESSLTAARNRAIVNYQNTPEVEGEIARQQAVIRDHAKRNGLPQEWIDEKVLAAASQTHAGVIERYLTTGEDRSAQSYYDAHKTEIAGTDQERIEKALEVGSTEGAGMRAASDAWKELGPKAPNDPVRIATMEDHLRSEYGDQPKVLRAAMQQLRTRAEAFNAEQRELTAANTASVLGAYNNGAALSEVVMMPQYRALSGTDQEKLKSYIVDRGRQLSAQRETLKTKANWVAYWENSEPTKLAAMSEAQIVALEPDMGPALTNQLLTQKRALTRRADGVIAATIDQESFTTIANDAGLRPFDGDQKETMGRLKNAVESEIGKQQEKANRPLTREEKEQVMKAIIDQKVMVDRFGPDNQRVRATLTPEERAQSYVPLADVPQEFVTSALNMLRSTGKLAPNVSDKVASQQLKRRLERAYSARLSNGSRADIDAILMGQK